MSEWWEEPYRGAPMVGPSLPRPLYPPDVVGYYPSADGPDVEAIKRTVWRLGRWPGPASGFDDSYSNAFAHGRSGNVGESGVAGFQRQQNIAPASGHIGKATYNALRSALVPEGREHAGEHGMDARAVELLEQAFELYHSKPKTPTREQALELARGEVGYRESPSGSNCNRFGEWYGCNGQPWCAMFVTWAFESTAGGSPSFVKGSRYAYCPYIVSDARKGAFGLSVTSSPIPGDVVVYDWSRDSVFDHVGIFEDGSSSYWTAIEGNTSTSSNSNGGEVMRRERRSSDAAVVFVRVDEP